MAAVEAYDKIRRRLEEIHPGVSDQKASLIVTGGENKDLIRGIKRGRSKFPRGDNLERLAHYLQVPVSWLAASSLGVGGLPGAPSNATMSSKVAGSGSLIPLYGSAVAGVDGEFELNGEELDRVIGPISLASVPEAYAVTVCGESMDPRYEDGETVFVNPTRRVKRGDYVVAQVQTEESGMIKAYVKRFVSRNAEALVLAQLNPEKELRFEGNSVSAVHYILRGGE